VDLVEYFLLPLPAPYNLVAFEFASAFSEFASASYFFLQSASASTKILPHPLPASASPFLPHVL